MKKTYKESIEEDCIWIEEKVNWAISKEANGNIPQWISTKNKRVNIQWGYKEEIKIPTNGILFDSFETVAQKFKDKSLELINKDIVDLLLKRNPNWFYINQKTKQNINKS